MVLLEETTYQELVNTSKAYESLAVRFAAVEAELKWLKEQIALSKSHRFSARSEKTPAGQQEMIFNEVEATAAEPAPEPPTETITYTRKKKQSGQRELDLSTLPVEIVEFRLSDEERVCPQCQGELHEMGEQVRQEIKHIPATLILIKNIRYKYACRNCQKEHIKTPILLAPMPDPPFPNSLASPSLVASLMTEKYVQAVPLYRQAQSFARMGFEISRQSMANWMIAGAGWLETVYSRLQAHLLRQEILHA